MVALLLCLALGSVAFVIGRGLLMTGMRNGDRLGDVRVGAVEPEDGGRCLSFVVDNPGPQPVLIGASVRRWNLRLLGESGQSVRVPRQSTRSRLLARQHTVIWAIPTGATQAVSVPLPPSIRRRVQLVVAIGEPDRLRVVSQIVKLRRSRRSPHDNHRAFAVTPGR